MMYLLYSCLGLYLLCWLEKSVELASVSSYLPFNFPGNSILVPEVVINPLPKFHFSIEFHPVPNVMIICHLVHNNNETL